MFPYRDENKTQRAAIITGVIIALNVLAWLFIERAGSSLAVARAVCNLGLIAGELDGHGSSRECVLPWAKASRAKLIRARSIPTSSHTCSCIGPGWIALET